MHRYFKFFACIFLILIACSFFVILPLSENLNPMPHLSETLTLLKTKHNGTIKPTKKNEHKHADEVAQKHKDEENDEPMKMKMNIKMMEWHGGECFSPSKSSAVLKQAMEGYSSFNTTCVNPWFYTIPNTCFMYASGTFNNSITLLHKNKSKSKSKSKFKSRPQVLHACFNREKLSDKVIDLQRSEAISGMIRSGRLGLNPERYFCDDELPLGLVDTSLSKLGVLEMPKEWYGRSEIFEHLKGRVLVFRGNSMTRQVFERVIFFLRGMKNFAEHYVHSYMIYGFDRERDVWDICIDQRFRKCGRSNKVTRAWPNLDDVALLYLEFTGGPPNKTVAASYDLTNFTVPFEKERVVATMIQETKGSRTEPNWFIARYEAGDKLEQMRLKLNPWVKAKLTGIGWPSKNSVRHNKPLGNCGTIRDAHFMCGLEPKFGTNLTKNNLVIKMPRNGDCSDPFNLNVAQRLFMFAFDKRVSWP